MTTDNTFFTNCISEFRQLRSCAVCGEIMGMNKPPPVSNSMYCFLPTEIEGFGSLAELALDMRWSWSHYGDELWRQLDPELWGLTKNPWVVLQAVSPVHLQALLTDTGFRREVDELLELKRIKSAEPAWFQQAHPEPPLSGVAYFSMEFMLSEALPIYSGGLGNVAGDQLKAASDLGVPVIGVGLLYQQGYFRQVIDRNGAQQALFPYNDPGQLPITPLREANGEWLRLQIALPGYSVWLRAWQAQVGRVKLYLLDSNDSANFPAHRGITSELYGGGPELRLTQELLLGIGGWRLLAALGILADVCHLNEGHAAFAVLERARGFMAETGQPFEVALAATRAGNLFTTHTAVAAGFDRFDAVLIEQYLRGYAEEALGISLHDLLALGRRNPGDSSERFNMAYLAIRGSGAVNGVSRLHGEVSRRLFGPLFPRWPAGDVPVGHVTNGVHTPTWDSAPADDLWTEACGKDRWLGTTERLEQDIRRVSDTRLWQFRIAASRSLVDYARERLSRQLVASGASPEAVDAAGHLFDPKWEACGTSGMKVLVNGGINLSVLDGWWAEAYTPEVGWALGDGREHGDDPAWDAVEAEALYNLLEHEVIPEFYTRDEQGIPTAWLGRMRESMARLTPRFSANRAVREYTEQHYLPAAAAYRLRAADRGAIAAQQVEWQRNLEHKWASIRFGDLKVETRDGEHTFLVEVHLTDLDPNAVRVELHADAIEGGAPVQQAMTRVREPADPSASAVYSAAVSAARPAGDYTARVVPYRDGVAIPLENAQISWQR